MNIRNNSITSLTRAWLLLIALTLVSLGLGKWTGTTHWLPLLVAFIIWIKCAIVAERFLETGDAHPLIRRVVYSFIALPPLALLAVAFTA